jgi:hypothetical protein
LALLIPVAIASAALAMPANSAARAKRRHECRLPTHTRLMARNSQLLAWQQDGKGLGYPGSSTAVVTLCSPPHGRLFPVFSSGHDASFTGLGEIEFAGPVIGFVSEDGNQYAEAQSLEVFDAAGHQLLGVPVEDWPIASTVAQPGFDGYVLNAAGDVAWVETNARANEIDNAETLLLRTSTGETTLATAQSVSQLAITSAAVTWFANGVSSSAPLPSTNGS